MGKGNESDKSAGVSSDAPVGFSNARVETTLDKSGT